MPKNNDQVKYDEATAKAWEGLLNKYGSLELERRMKKLKSYKAYFQRWPWEGASAPLSLDALNEQGFPLVDQLVSTGPDFQTILQDKELLEDFLETLSPKQQEIVAGLLNGLTTKELYRHLQHKNTSRIRYHKHAMRLKLDGITHRKHK